MINRISNPGRRLTQVLSLAAGLLLAGCSTSDSATTPSVLATVPVWAEVTEQLLCADQQTVEALAPPGADLHDYELSLQQRADLAEADLVIQNGLGLEEDMSDVLTNAVDQGAIVVNVGSFLADDEVLRSEDGDPDPHFWLDPQLVAETVPQLAAELVEAGVIADEAMTQCQAELLSKLEALDAAIAQQMSDVAPERRAFISGHGVLEYFANRYELDSRGSVSGDHSTHTETDAEHLAELLELVEEEGITTVFMSAGEPDDAVTALQADGDVTVVELGTSPQDGQSYQAMMETLARDIGDALN